MTDVPPSHPRHESLRIRQLIVAGVEAGLTSVDGLIAHGRGEAFDYLLGEQTHHFALAGIEAAAVILTGAKRPVLSVNGNAAALIPDELVKLARQLHAPLEVNLFHPSPQRERAIQQHLIAHGAQQVLLPGDETVLEGTDSNRRFIHREGIGKADAVFVPLEDGDRCEALRRAGKQVVTIDLNPLSRTAQTATITIVDNIVRAAGVLLETVEQLGRGSTQQAKAVRGPYDNERTLSEAIDTIRKGL